MPLNIPTLFNYHTTLYNSNHQQTHSHNTTTHINTSILNHPPSFLQSINQSIIIHSTFTSLPSLLPHSTAPPFTLPPLTPSSHLSPHSHPTTSIFLPIISPLPFTFSSPPLTLILPPPFHFPPPLPHHPPHTSPLNPSFPPHFLPHSPLSLLLLLLSPPPPHLHLPPLPFAESARPCGGAPPWCGGDGRSSSTGTLHTGWGGGVEERERDDDDE